MMKSDKIFPLHPYKGETHKMTKSVLDIVRYPIIL